MRDLLIIIQIPTLLLFGAALGMLMLTGLFWLLFARRKAHKPHMQFVESTKIMPEIFIEDGHFMLQGRDWQWIADQQVGYRCPCCKGFEELLLRLYRYVPANGKVFLIAQHNCEHPHAEGIATDPSLDAIGGGK